MRFDPTRPDLTGAPLARDDYLRADPDAVAALWRDPAARVLAFTGGNPLLREGGSLMWLTPDSPLVAGREAVLLGLQDGAPRFAVGLAEADPPKGAAFVEMRGALLGGVFGGEEAAIAATAKALVNWHHAHGFCARCGARSRMVNAGWRRDCTACEAPHFPRTDPVVIMLIENGPRCALARNVTFPPRLFSCVAGFVEPGESVEDAVRRETAEELGLAVTRVAYVSSQPWPFPASLMLGCIAETGETAFTLEAAEIAEARWFTRDDIRAVLAGESAEVAPPRKAAIARTLLLDWLDGRIGFSAA